MKTRSPEQLIARCVVSGGTDWNIDNQFPVVLGNGRQNMNGDLTHRNLLPD